MVAHTKTMKVGDGTIEGTTHGPVQNLMQFERVKEFFNEIEKESWMVAVGGTISETMGKGGRKGYYVGPTIIDRPEETSRIVVEEPFGENSHISYSILFLLLRCKVGAGVNY
jgi:acyl-CoA reductase-like NAD-dependent aldehyde dehydrogenase